MSKYSSGLGAFCQVPLLSLAVLDGERKTSTYEETSLLDNVDFCSIYAFTLTPASLTANLRLSHAALQHYVSLGD